MQAVRPLRTCDDSLARNLDPNWYCCSFELGGDKKTKGAALTFVRRIFNPACVIIPTCFAVTIILYLFAMYPLPCDLCTRKSIYYSVLNLCAMIHAI